MKPSLQLKLGQHLTMTPQLQQAIRLLQLSTLELQTEIQQALEENPMLEYEDDGSDATVIADINNDANTKTTQVDSSETRLDMDKNQEMPDDFAVDSTWEDTYDITTATASSNQQSDDSGNDYLENRSAQGDSLSEHLIWQLQNSQFTETDLIIAIAIIDAINEDGYLTETVEEIHAGLVDDLDIDLDEVEAVLHRVQRFDPVGVASRNLRECLLLQLELFDPATPELADVKNIIEFHLDLLGAHDYARLQKKIRRNEEQLKKLITFIQALNPKPGASISNNTAQYVIPHPITGNFNLVTAFPFARALGREDSDDQADSEGHPTHTQWQRSTLVEAASNGWVSRTPIPENPHFDKNRDIPGPFSLAVALQRTINAREQRIVVVGSGSFLANAYSGNGGNLDLGINMVNWLSHEENLITTQPRATVDSSISLSKKQLSVISISFVIVLPLLLLLTGGILWWRRRE